MKFTDIGAAVALSRDWNEARLALTRTRKINLNVTISRERETLISLPASLVVNTVLERLQGLRTEMMMMGITEIPPNDPAVEQMEINRDTAATPIQTLDWDTWLAMVPASADQKKKYADDFRDGFLAGKSPRAAIDNIIPF